MSQSVRRNNLKCILIYITKKGKDVLKEKETEWKIFSNGVNKVLGGVSFAN